MRVIAGICRSLKLKTLPGDDVRPTTDRIKETLFNMLSPDIPGSRFIDLFSGSGAIGIEALSRGAGRAWFVDSSPRAIRCIEENLSFTRLSERAEVILGTALGAVEKLEKSAAGPADIIFMDPPYGKKLEDPVLQRLRYSSLVSERTILIVEEKAGTDFSFAEALGYRIIKIKSYGSNCHVWLRLNEGI